MDFEKVKNKSGCKDGGVNVFFVSPFMAKKGLFMAKFKEAKKSGE